MRRSFWSISIALFLSACATYYAPQSAKPNVGLRPHEHVMFFRSYGRQVNGGKQWELKVTGRIWFGGDAPEDAADRNSRTSFFGKIGAFFESDVVGERLKLELLTPQGKTE